MSLAAPTSFAFTGGATLTIAVTWGGSPVAATMSINSVTYKFTDVFDKAQPMVNDLTTAGTGTGPYGEKLFQALQILVIDYFQVYFQSLLPAAQQSVVALPINVAIS